MGTYGPPCIYVNEILQLRENFENKVETSEVMYIYTFASHRVGLMWHAENPPKI